MKNYPVGSVRVLYGIPSRSVSWYEQFYHSLTGEEQNSIQCVTAHTSQFLIPVLQRLQRPFSVICLLRDPVDRAVSFYHFALAMADTGTHISAQIGQIIRKMNWKIEDIYLNLGAESSVFSEYDHLFHSFFNGQSRAILSPFFPDLPLIFAEAANGRSGYENFMFAVLDRHYSVGLQEKFEISIDRFAAEFGWTHVEYQRKNATAGRPKVDALSSDVLNLIREYNHLDTKLHNLYAARF